MNYTRSEVEDYVREEDVKFIRLAFTDVMGNPKNISIRPGELSRAFGEGIGFDGSAIPGFGRDAKSDLLLLPDPSTLSVLPWRPSHGRVVRMYCDIRRPGGGVFPCDARTALRSVAEKARAAGASCRFGAEYEFYLFKTDEKGAPTSEPFDNAGYMDIAPADAGENVRREICLNLDEMGITPESSHHEEGPGQNEIDFKYSDALAAADDAVTFRTVVRTVAARNGLFADFSPKPLPGMSGNGLHINVSIADTDKQPAFMAGVMAHIREITAFLNPLPASYQRLGCMKAPRYVSWSPENRSQLIRIPASGGCRMELRSPDGAANPYLAFAAVAAAGLDGIEKAMTPPPPMDADLFSAPEAILSGLERLPDTLAQAVEITESSEFIAGIFPHELTRAYLALMRA